MEHRRHGLGRRRLRDLSDTETNVPALPLRTESAAVRDFDTNDWAHLTPAERIAHCYRMASEAQSEGSHATDRESKERFLRLAKAWLDLALEIKDSVSQPMRNAGGR